MGPGEDEERAKTMVSPSGMRYVIRLKGRLDAHWSEWLDGMALTHEAAGVTRLEGAVSDQAALYGLLNKIRDLSLPLLTVQQMGDAGEPPACDPNSLRDKGSET